MCSAYLLDRCHGLREIILSAVVQLVSLSLIQSVKFVEHGGGGSPRAATLPGTTFEYPNWTGDGRLEDSVLRCSAARDARVSPKDQR
jgi:hypothetical protein